MTQVQWQARMDQLPSDKQAALSADQQQYTDNTPFSGPIPESMNLYRQFAFTHVNEVHLNVSFKYWEYLMRGKIDSFTLSDITTVLVACQGRTLREWLNFYPYKPEDMATGPINDWGLFRTEVKAMEDAIEEPIETNFNRLYQKYMTMKHLDLSGQSKSIPKNHQNPVVAAHRAIHGTIPLK